MAMKQFSKWIIALIVLLSVTTFSNYVQAVQIPDEIIDTPQVVYGANLSQEQKEEVRRLLDINPEEVNEMEVTGEDIHKYIGGDINSRMFSSVKITHKEEGTGIIVNIVTPQNITEVTSEMYKNALLTAGVENALIEVASPIPVTGGSALTGIYKAYDEAGVDLDPERMEVANDELELTTELSKKEGLSDEVVTELMTEIKKAIADQDPATKEDIERIIQEQLDRLEINLSEQDRQLLIDLFDKMRQLDIDFNKVKAQLEDISNIIKDKLNELDVELDASFWEKVKNFINDIIDMIASFFTSDSNGNQEG